MKSMKAAFLLGASACTLMASSVFATAIESVGFEDAGAAGYAQWTANTDASVVDDTVTAPVPAGFPTAAATSSKVLSIMGTAERTYDAANGDTLVDMMVKVSKPDEALAALDTDSLATTKFALAVDSDGKFKYFSGTAWVAVASTAYENDTWVRVTMKFDYTNGKCTVQLDGDTAGTYSLVQSAAKLGSIEVKGYTAIDEVVVTQDSLKAAFADATAVVGNSGVTKKWLTDHDVNWSTDLNATVNDGSNLTLAEKFAFGLEPADGRKFALEFAQNTDASKALFTFPGFGAKGGAGRYVLQTSTDNATWSGSTVVAPSGTGVNSVEVDISGLTAGVAQYYRIVAQSAE